MGIIDRLQKSIVHARTAAPIGVGMDCSREVPSTLGNRGGPFQGGWSSASGFLPCHIFGHLRVCPPAWPQQSTAQIAICAGIYRRCRIQRRVFRPSLPIRISHSKIVAVEPESKNVTQLRKNCLNYSNISIEHAAVWSKTAKLSIKSPDAETNAFQVREVIDGDIQAISIDDIITKYDLPRIDLLKIDIEGSEKEVFSASTAQVG